MTTTETDPLVNVLLATARLEQECLHLLEQVQGQPASLDTPCEQAVRSWLWQLAGIEAYLSGLASPTALRAVQKSIHRNRRSS
jgi:hypothetical protein